MYSLIGNLFFLVCIDCEVAWVDWSECEGGLRRRWQEIVAEPVGAGAACPELGSDFEGNLYFRLYRARAFIYCL